MGWSVPSLWAIQEGFGPATTQGRPETEAVPVLDMLWGMSQASEDTLEVRFGFGRGLVLVDSGGWELGTVEPPQHVGCLPVLCYLASFARQPDFCSPA